MSRAPILAFATLALLAACGSNVQSPGGHGGSSSSSGTGGVTTGSTTTTGSIATGGGGAGTGLPPGTCRSDSDCYPGGFGGGPIGCVTADACIDGVTGCIGDHPGGTSCMSDADCAGPGVPSGLVCWTCGGGGGICRSACTDDTSCGPAQTCDGQGHCTPKTCAGSSDCPANFNCAPESSVCIRKTCSADAECAGYCIYGRCSEKLGSCLDCT